MTQGSEEKAPQSSQNNQKKLQDSQPDTRSNESTEFPEELLELLRAEKANLPESGLPRTNLDPEAMRLALARATAEKELKIAEQLKAKASEPPKPFLPIENFKMATPCSSIWEGTNPGERVRYCQNCQLQVYDFTGLEQPEADDLIFKRESRRNVCLFKRQDGKFLTSDCPVATKGKRNTIVAVAVAGVLVICVIAMLILAPKPAPNMVTRPAVAPIENDNSSSVVTKSTNQSPTSPPTSNSEAFKLPPPQSTADVSTNTPVPQSSVTAPQSATTQPEPAASAPTFPGATGQPTTGELTAPSPSGAPEQPTSVQPDAPAQQITPSAGNPANQPQPAAEQSAPSDRGVKYYGR